MLSRTADSLYWMARYMERADYLARILDAALRLTVLPTRYGGESGAEWPGAVASAGVRNSFKAAHGEADEAKVCAFLAFDTGHPGSIVSCLNRARVNARSVRTALTTEMW